MDDMAASESEAKTDEELLDAQKATISKDLPDLEETIVQSVIQTSLTDTSMEGSSGASVAVTHGTNAQDQSVTTVAFEDNNFSFVGGVSTVGEILIELLNLSFTRGQENVSVGGVDEFEI
uniref:Uncharacterized protein n=1 Tax=Solanum tuberosum TaxID=4113 RepID=M1DJH5_SOLTU